MRHRVYVGAAMTNPTDILIAKRARIAEMESAIAVERAELRGMEMMAEMLAGSDDFRTKIERLSRVIGEAAAVTPRGPARSFGGNMADEDWSRVQTAYHQVTRGRQPGSISKRWRAVLWRLDRLGGNFSPTDIVAVVRELESRDMRAADAKRQMETYAEFNFVTGENGTYNVTDEFRSKFADAADSSNENEASVADAADASETGLEGL